MTRYLRGYADRSAATTDAMGQPIRFVASSEGVKRDGLSIRAAGWQLDEYTANPAVLWSHDYRGERPPIGRAERVWVEGDRLMADITFDTADDFAAAVERKYRSGFLNTVSVGWDIEEQEGHEVTRANLIDISAVNIPGDPGALMERQARALRNLGQTLLEAIDDDDTDEPRGFAREVQWEGTALRMARLFLAGTEDRSEYKRLEREYQRLGRTAPEWPDHLAALDAETIRGLFVENEPDLLPELFAVEAEPVPDTDDLLKRLHAALMGDTTNG